MKRISAVLSKWLLHVGAISADSAELYEYAIYSFLFSLFPLLVVLCIGVVLNMVLEGVMMIVPFMLIRKFSGGYHLKSSVVCTVSSIAILSLFLLLIRLVLQNGWIAAFSLFVCGAALCIFLCSPIDSEERRLSEKERHIFRIICRIMLAVFLALYGALCLLQLHMCAASIGAGITLTALLQLPCLVLRAHARLSAHRKPARHNDAL